MRTYEDTFSGQKIYPGKVCAYILNSGFGRAATWEDTMGGDEA